MTTSRRVDRIAVYARTRPEQKVDIVAAWQDRGDVVAMTGDGVNDGPALRRADIGIAMGERGTEVARQAADLVLADDDLATVVVAVGEGRRIYTNIRLFLRYGLSGGLAEVLVILLGPFLGLPVPLAPGQILWINMITHGVPGVAFGGEPMDPAVMRRPSPSPQRSVLGPGLVSQIVQAALLIAGVSLLAGRLAPPSQLQTWVFLTLGLAQLGVALAIRAPRAGTGWRDRGLEAAVLGAAALQVLAVTWAPLRDLLGTRALTPADAVVVTGLAVAAGRGAPRPAAARGGAESHRARVLTSESTSSSSSPPPRASAHPPMDGQDPPSRSASDGTPRKSTSSTISAAMAAATPGLVRGSIRQNVSRVLRQATEFAIWQTAMVAKAVPEARASRAGPGVSPQAHPDWRRTVVKAASEATASVAPRTPKARPSTARFDDRVVVATAHDALARRLGAQRQRREHVGADVQGQDLQHPDREREAARRTAPTSRTAPARPRCRSGGR